MKININFQRLNVLNALGIAFFSILFLGTQSSFKQSDSENKDLLTLSETASLAATTPVAYIIQLSSDNATLASDFDDIIRKNIYGICWEGKVEDNLRFAKQMGYTYVVYQTGMENSSQAENMYFLFHKPERLIARNLGVNTAYIHLNTTYTAAQQEAFKSNFALKNNTKPFPNNIANGWFSFGAKGVPNNFAVVPDWQQKKVVDLALDISYVEVIRIEIPARNFLCGGFAWDEPELTGDFSSDSAAYKTGKNVAVTLAHWTGGDRSALYPGTTHEYATHSDGKAEFYKGLKSIFKDKYPDRKQIYLWEPYRLNNDYLDQIMLRSDKDELLSDVLLFAEGHNNQLTQFADDATLFQPGKLKRDWVGSTQPNEHRFSEIKKIVGKAGIHGSWFGWFGRYDEGPINNIDQIPNWHQLARVIPSWDNLCGVPLNERNYNVTEYRSSNSCMSDKVLYSRQPKTNKLFVVFMDSTGTIPLKPGDKVISVKRVDKMFCETVDAASELNITSNMISLSTSTNTSSFNSNEFSVSPNPAKDFITLRMDNLHNPISFQIVDVSGKIMNSGIISENNSNIPINKLGNGAYFLRLFCDNDRLETIKFIKEKI